VTAPAQTILVVDDDRGLVRLIEKALQREGFSTASAPSGLDALHWLQHQRAALMLLDLKLQDIGAKDLVARLNQGNHCPPFIIITGQGDERVAVEMMKLGARDYLVKDVDFLQFVPAVVKRALAQLENERRLAEAEEQVRVVRGVVEQGFSAVLITDGALPDPQIVYINPSFARVTGYEAAKVVGRPLSSLAGLHRVSERLRAGLPKNASFLEEVSTYQTPHGERWGEWRVGPVKDKTGKDAHWLIIFRDITESKRLEKEILEISDRERFRLGQDLHDGLCQHLAGIELMCQVLEQKLGAKTKTDAARVGEIGRHVREAITQTRALARGLSPVTLELDGLTSALHELAANTEKMFGVNCRVECPRPVEISAPAVATHLYRIAQEAVSNAIKHGKATEILIRLELTSAGNDSTDVRLSVSDNGRGFATTPSRTTGMGLHIMRYRAGVISGSLAIEPNPAGGARLVCTAPVEKTSRKSSPHRPRPKA
jgi:PAS domain S-box-containing protein